MIDRKLYDFKISYVDTLIKDREPLEHYHDAYEIIFYLKADLRVFIKDEQFDITDGNLLFINEYDLHKMFYKSNKEYRRYVIYFKKSFISEVLDSLRAESLLEVLNKSGSRKISLNTKIIKDFEKLCEALCYAYTSYNDSKDALMLSVIKANLALFLINYRQNAASAQPTQSSSKTAEQVQNIISYIDQYYMNDITLSQLEERFYLNKYHISHIFKEITGFTVVEYIQYRRIIEAEKLLKNSRKSLTDICFDCGFNNIQHFHRVFKKIKGLTPSYYRAEGAAD